MPTSQYCCADLRTAFPVKIRGFLVFLKTSDIQWFTSFYVAGQLIPLCGKAFPVLRKSPFRVMTCTVSRCGTGIFMTSLRCFCLSKRLSQFYNSIFPDIHDI